MAKPVATPSRTVQNRSDPAALASVVSKVSSTKSTPVKSPEYKKYRARGENDPKDSAARDLFAVKGEKVTCRII